MINYVTFIFAHHTQIFNYLSNKLCFNLKLINIVETIYVKIIYVNDLFEDNLNLSDMPVPKLCSSIQMLFFLMLRMLILQHY